VKTGLNINTKKTEVMRINNKKQDPITLHDEDLNEVEKFVYLGSVVNKDGGTDEVQHLSTEIKIFLSTPSGDPES